MHYKNLHQLGRFRRSDYGHATPETREAERQSIQAQLDEWLNDGNRIQQVPAGVTSFKGGRMNVTGLSNPNGLRVSRRRPRKPSAKGATS